MNEYLDVRLSERWAAREFGEGFGQPMFLDSGHKADWEAADPANREYLRPITRQVLIPTDDPFLPELRSRILGAQKKGVYAAGSIITVREFDDEELQRADFLRLVICETIEQFGAESGTVYDDSHACSKCGFGLVQRSPLRLDLSKVPKGIDIARTLAQHEYIVSERFAAMARAESLAGLSLDAVEHVGKRGAGQMWYQLRVVGRAGKTCPPTRFGEDYIRDRVDPQYTCGEHGLMGLNLITTVTLAATPDANVDLMATTDRFLRRSGDIMPVPILVVGKRCFAAFRSYNIQGGSFEPVSIGRTST